MFTGKQKVTSPKTSNARKPGKQNSLDASGEDGTVTISVGDVEKTPVSKTESQPESLDESQKTDKPGVDEEMYDSESSESDDDDEVTGLTEEEEKERQREKREKVYILLLLYYIQEKTSLILYLVNYYL